ALLRPSPPISTLFPYTTLFRSYWKLRRRGSFDFPVLSVAAAVRFGKGGVVEDARIVLGAVASHPVLVPAAASLVGQPLTDEAIRSEEHTSELQSLRHLVCRLLL